MDEKTEELRDIFLSVSEEDTVTEQQQAGRGTLDSEGEVRDSLRSVIEDMREDVGFDTSLSIADLVTVVESFYDGASDAEIARELEADLRPRNVRRVRMDLHLVRERDREAPFSLDRLKTLLETGDPTTDIAEELDVSPSTVRRYRRVVETQSERRRVADRYRGEFETVFQNRDLADRLTSSLEETGLEGATEGQEVDVDM